MQKIHSRLGGTRHEDYSNYSHVLGYDLPEPVVIHNIIIAENCSLD